MSKHEDLPHPLREAGLVPDDGRWLADDCSVVLWWDVERMDWFAGVTLPSGRQILTRFRWQDLKLNVEQDA